MWSKAEVFAMKKCGKFFHFDMSSSFLILNMYGLDARTNWDSLVWFLIFRIVWSTMSIFKDYLNGLLDNDMTMAVMSVL